MLGRSVLSGSETLGESRLGVEELQNMYKSLEIIIKFSSASFVLKRCGGVEVRLHMFFN